MVEGAASIVLAAARVWSAQRDAASAETFPQLVSDEPVSDAFHTSRSVGTVAVLHFGELMCESSDG
jgi:hypothetical protein